MSKKLAAPVGYQAHVGETFGRLTIERVFFQDDGKRRNAYATCQCACGRAHTTRMRGILTGSVKSCGCHKREVDIARRFVHGHTASSLNGPQRQTPEYMAWHGMRDRCSRPAHRQWESYGGRGIKVCPAWESFEVFLADMGLKPFPEASIERVDNALGYSPKNCVWTTKAQQARNRRTNRWVIYRGKRVCIAELATLSAVGQTGLLSRLNRGWPIELAVHHPPFGPRIKPVSSTTLGKSRESAPASP